MIETFNSLRIRLIFATLSFLLIIFVVDVFLLFIDQSRQHLNCEIYKFSEEYHQDIEKFNIKYQFRPNYVSLF